MPKAHKKRKAFEKWAHESELVTLEHSNAKKRMTNNVKQCCRPSSSTSNETTTTSTFYKKNESRRNNRQYGRRFGPPKSNSNGHCPSGRPSYNYSKKSNHRCESQGHSDLPGFYYDAEKKKYFKILPGHNNVNVVTRESVATKKAEEKRLKDISSGVQRQTSTDSVSEKKINKSVQISIEHSKNMVHIAHRMHMGKIDRTNLESIILKTRLQKLKIEKSCKIFPSPFGQYEKLNHMLVMSAAPDFCHILGLWSIKKTLATRIQLLQVNVKKKLPLENRRSGLDLDIQPFGNVVLQSLNKITHVCWAPSVDSPTRKHILYTTMCYTGNSPSLALVRNLEPSEGDGFRATDFCLGNKATWTCAWNPYKQQFSVGTEKHGILLDVHTRKLWELFSNNSDVLAQVFTTNDEGQTLLSGTRKGEILTHDLRSRSTYPVKTLYQRSPISSLKLLQDEIYLLASDFSGAIKLWDLRMRKVVVDFHGNVNLYSKLPLHVDQSETVLYSVGEDCYTRFWNLKTGAQIKTLPPPCPASRDTIPTVHYSQRWGGQWGQAGLLMGMNDELHFFDSHDVWS